MFECVWILVFTFLLIRLKEGKILSKIFKQARTQSNILKLTGECSLQCNLAEKAFALWLNQRANVRPRLPIKPRTNAGKFNWQVIDGTQLPPKPRDVTHKRSQTLNTTKFLRPWKSVCMQASELEPQQQNESSIRLLSKNWTTQYEKWKYTSPHLIWHQYKSVTR